MTDNSGLLLKPPHKTKTLPAYVFQVLFIPLLASSVLYLAAEQIQEKTTPLDSAIALSTLIPNLAFTVAAFIECCPHWVDTKRTGQLFLSGALLFSIPIVMTGIKLKILFPTLDSVSKTINIISAVIQSSAMGLFIKGANYMRLYQHPDRCHSGVFIAACSLLLADTLMSYFWATFNPHTSHHYNNWPFALTTASFILKSIAFTGLISSFTKFSPPAKTSEPSVAV